ncbi:hypothetical protein NB311A_06131 [Nitrobacter sp. Nb-311A]|nr:hypothetical protein NB311A_06131 [Nitrobacter sp. Nb-311A]
MSASWVNKPPDSSSVRWTGAVGVLWDEVGKNLFHGVTMRT